MTKILAQRLWSSQITEQNKTVKSCSQKPREDYLIIERETIAITQFYSHKKKNNQEKINTPWKLL